VSIHPFSSWILASSDDVATNAIAVLDDAERERSARLVRVADRAAFITAHAALRFLLSDAIEVSPAEIRLSTAGSGKPSLATAHACGDIDFSISHTDGLVALALSRRGAIGIDVERRRAVPDRLGVASRVFGGSVAEQLGRFRETEQHDIFLRLWTAGEAYVKATGYGIAGIQTHLPFELAIDGTPLLLLGAAPLWTLLTLKMPGDYVGSVVVEGTSAHEIYVPETTTLDALRAASKGC
jgi:4'-phosphopantetheinyl transferase